MPRFLLPSFEGLEDVTGSDALSLGARKAEPLVGRVVAEGDVGFLYRANLAHPTASKVHLVLAEGEVATAEDCARVASQVDWRGVVREGQSFAVECLRIGEHAWTSLDAERKVGAAVQAQTGARVDLRAPDVEVHVHVREGWCYVAVNTSGASLHDRGYRVYQHPAPLNPCLASAMVALSGWREGVLLDPLCGSGTIPLEADFRARRRAVNLGRQEWAFQRMGLHDEDRYQAERDALACEALDEGPPVWGNEQHAKHLEGAVENGRAAAAHVRWSVGDFDLMDRPPGLSRVVTNPPWGIRIAGRKASDRIGAQLRAKLAAWAQEGPLTALVLMGNQRFEKEEPRPAEARSLLYGGAACRLLTYRLG